MTAQAVTDARIDDVPHRPLAVVTGASSGIGAAFAEALAARGMNLVVIGRRGERLQQLERRHATIGDISVHAIVADLVDRAALRSVEDEIRELACVDMLVNCAGFGIFEGLAASDPDQVERQLFLDLIVPARLTNAVVAKMIVRRKGAIINVSSMAAFLPIPNFASYCAAKAGLTRFTEALHGELAGTGVRVQALCPGPVPTEFFAISGYDIEDVPRPMLQLAEACVESSLRALENGKVVHVPQLAVRLFLAFLSLFSSSTKARILGRGTEWWTKKAVPARRAAYTLDGRQLPGPPDLS